MPLVDLTFARGIVAQLATDTCTIYRDAGTSDDTFDPVTLTWERTTPTVAYTGPAWFRDLSTNIASDGLQGEAEATLQRYTVKLPSLAADVRVGDIVVMTATGDALGDFSLLGIPLIVRDIGGGTYKIARRLNCERWVKGTTEDWLT